VVKKNETDSRHTTSAPLLCLCCALNESHFFSSGTSGVETSSTDLLFAAADSDMVGLNNELVGLRRGCVGVGMSWTAGSVNRTL
jgi:hypothetical protein